MRGLEIEIHLQIQVKHVQAPVRRVADGSSRPAGGRLLLQGNDFI
jgi:hypothetical protein